jgi:hypothetical protein
MTHPEYMQSLARIDERERRLRSDLSPQELDLLAKYGSLNFKSLRCPDMRTEVFVPSRDQH